jgi:hypothetical protein
MEKKGKARRGEGEIEMEWGLRDSDEKNEQAAKREKRREMGKVRRRHTV